MLEGYNLLSEEEKQNLSNSNEDNSLDSKNDDYVNNDDDNKVRIINLIDNENISQQTPETKESLELLNKED